jgi:hypothetical protein
MPDFAVPKGEGLGDRRVVELLRAAFEAHAEEYESRDEFYFLAFVVHVLLAWHPRTFRRPDSRKDLPLDGEEAAVWFYTEALRRSVRIDRVEATKSPKKRGSP